MNVGLDPIPEDEAEFEDVKPQRITRSPNFYGIDNSGKPIREETKVKTVEKEFFVEVGKEHLFVMDLQSKGWTITKCYLLTREKCHIIAKRTLEK